MNKLQKSFVMATGERYCLLVERSSGLPEFYPNLYITTQIRNKSLSYSSMESALNAISILLRFFATRNEDIEKRFLDGHFLDVNELDAIRDFCQNNFRSTNIITGTTNLYFFPNQNKKVSTQTQYVRLTVIAQYLKWFANLLSGHKNDRFSMLQISKMEKGLMSRRHVKKKRNQDSREKGLNKNQIDLIFEIFRPDSDINPFKERSVRIRNRLIFLILYHLGLRGGELLNIRIRDIDFAKNQLVIARRADEKDDTRIDQPLVKTLDRRLPMKETLANEIHRYILNERKSVPNAAKNDFLFITHKSGQTQGQPLSKSGYKKVIGIVRQASPSLFNLTGHQLRHSWNEIFSEHMDSMDTPPSEIDQEKIRSYLMGWKEGSGTASVYNARFVRRKANEAALKLQEGMLRLPKGI